MPDRTVPEKVRWGVLGVAKIATNKVIPAMQKGDWCEVAAIASRDLDKAKTAAMFKRPSKVFQDAVAGGGAGLRVLGLQGAIPVEGGVPIIVNGQIVGAIGVSGGSSEQDGVCAQAGASAVK